MSFNLATIILYYCAPIIFLADLCLITMLFKFNLPESNWRKILCTEQNFFLSCTSRSHGKRVFLSVFLTCPRTDNIGINFALSFKIRVLLLLVSLPSKARERSLSILIVVKERWSHAFPKHWGKMNTSYLT